MGTVALDVFGTLVCSNLPWHNLIPYLYTGIFERPRTKKEALIAGSFQLGIELPLFLDAANLAVF